MRLVCSRAADDLGGLVAVHPGHVDVEQDDRELALQQVAQRLLARSGDDDLGDVLEHGRMREQVALVVVDDQHPRALGRPRPATPAPPSAERLRLRLADGLGARSRLFRRRRRVDAPALRRRSRDRAIHTRSSASSRSMSTGLAI